MSAQRRPGFTATDAPVVREHARRRWAERGDPSIPVEQAWREAEPRPCGVLNARFEREHHPTGCVLLAYRIAPGAQSRVVLRTVLGPEQSVVPDWIVEDVPGGGR